MFKYRRFVTSAILILCASTCTYALDYTSHQECRTCHSDIFKLWSSSLHARSYSNPSFQASFVKLLVDKGKQTGRLCLKCHAPLAHLTGNLEFESAPANEGVSCWYCHSVSSVNRDADIDGYYNLDTSGVFYGPFPAVDPEDHPVIQSDLHLKAELCAGCHQYTNVNGVDILETLSEWQQSSYSKNEVYCQNCHMPIMVDLSVVDGREVEGYYVTAHEFQGGHSRINLKNAVTMVTEVTQQEQYLTVTVRITNAESGHKLPTGVPIRKLVLQVTLKNKANLKISTARKVYRKALVDKYGTILESASQMFLEATDIYSDNRINPQETRVEEFTFKLPRKVKQYKIETVLNYEYTRPLLADETVSVQMATNKVSSRDVK